MAHWDALGQEMNYQVDVLRELRVPSDAWNPTDLLCVVGSKEGGMMRPATLKAILL